MSVENDYTHSQYLHIPSPDGPEFTVTPTQLLIIPGVLLYNISVIVNEDGAIEGNGLFTFSLTTGDEGVNIEPSSTAVSIIDTSKLTVLSYCIHTSELPSMHDVYVPRFLGICTFYRTRNYGVLSIERILRNL